MSVSLWSEEPALHTSTPPTRTGTRTRETFPTWGSAASRTSVNSYGRGALQFAWRRLLTLAMVTLGSTAGRLSTRATATRRCAPTDPTTHLLFAEHQPRMDGWTDKRIYQKQNHVFSSRPTDLIFYGCSKKEIRILVISSLKIKSGYHILRYVLRSLFALFM